MSSSFAKTSLKPGHSFRAVDISSLHKHVPRATRTVRVISESCSGSSSRLHASRLRDSDLSAKRSFSLGSLQSPARRPTATRATVTSLPESGSESDDWSDKKLEVSPEDLTVPQGYLLQFGTPSCEMNRSQYSPSDYLKKVLTSKVYDVAVETPLEEAKRLSERVSNTLLLKREDLQPVFSFKIRGAYNRMVNLTKEELSKGVITASAGNHAQGVALSAAALGTSAIIAMPEITPAIKVNAVRRLGGEVKLFGETFDATQAWAKQVAEEEGRVFIPPFDHPDVIAGQGTVGMEILRQCSSPDLDHVFVPVGGGGLIAGIAAYIKCLRPDVKIIGVEPAGANAMAQSLLNGRQVTLKSVNAFADGVAVKEVGSEPFALCQSLVDGVVLVSQDAICAAIKDVFEDTRSILEPAGACALAGAKAYLEYNNIKGSTSVVVTSGANMNFDRLRLVAELADIGAAREALLASSIPEKAGAFKEFVNTIGSDTSITEFKYRRQEENSAHVLYGVSVDSPTQIQALVQRLEVSGVKTLDLSNDTVGQMHMRDLVGGQSGTENERLYTVEFPEKAGALEKFLDQVSPRWDITLFHYRNNGSSKGEVLLGMQVPDSESYEVLGAVTAIGYPIVEVTDNAAYKLFMRLD
mmetsp:Transcript_10082/g.11782  ORF Transcript_10082/g.11782 Transcript_10082/m.11782 type:complete len:638 (-) Transcript_10082:154-2067(-)|eukprot:CAMPEP_0197849366 /NCGR_PEP_ID=MMETSP1438-20131217/11768_1 /TAXON_ID=1461541 /ORGANISM="Pterosperma sp., Strain CCMP1384" /LENGTH=637 /DNA_ID=CAMNT_0043462007 /DNA_START=423 /DNA_END=2336 /DNA_ORIENTATION=+